MPENFTSGRIISGKKRNIYGGNPLARKVLNWMMLLVFFGVAIYVFFFSPLMAVNSIIVSGTESLDNEKITNVVNSAISGKYLDLVNRNNLILLSKKNIIQALKSNFKKIQSVEINKEFPDKILVKIAERQSSLVFCSGDPCYVIDSAGRAYAAADFQSGELGENELTILRDLSQKNISIDDVFLDKDLLSFVQAIRNRIKIDLDIDVKQEFSTPTLISGDIRVETADGWKVYFNKDIGIDKEMEMLKTALNNSIDKNRKNDLDYIDLRVDNKVYYKFK